MDDEKESLHRYGTPLEPLDEDEILTKKPINIEDQIVTDENGKRRFHGAFTGGFSAGFWNTVGSLEGWKPTSFKSSRSEKAPKPATQRPEDFMDDEDLGEFGIAPQRIEIKTDYQIEGRKRKFMQPELVASGGPIPGEPALATLLQPITKDKIAVRILKSMGWKPGQGIGPRLTAKEKRRTRARNKREEYILRKYADEDGSKLGTSANNNENKPVAGSEDSTDEAEDDDDDEITFAPDDYEPLICRVKVDRFGLGYTSLRENENSSAQSTKKLQHFELFGPLEVLDKHNKKMSFTGQAFGVGALEEEDDDIYARDDLSKYDFSLEDKKEKQKVVKHVQDKHIIAGYAAAQDTAQFQPPFLIELADEYLPRNWALRRSRFAPLAPEKARELEDSVAFRKRGLGRHDLNPDKRGSILEDNKKQDEPQQIAPPPQAPKRSLEELQLQQRTRNERTKALLERISSKSNNFTRGGIINTEGEEILKNDEMKKSIEKEQQNLLTKASEKTKDLGTTSTEFKPFLQNEAKQQRYEKFLAANLRDETEILEFLAKIQPVELSEWDREMEKKEFIQARKIYKPLGGIMSERFISETTLDAEKTKIDSSKSEKNADTKKIEMVRSKEMWKPQSLLCKRYNIAEPFGGSMEDVDARPAKKAKLSIFDYLETSVNTKANFQTPVIIPKHIEKPKALIDNRPKPQKTIEEHKEVEHVNDDATETKHTVTVEKSTSQPQPEQRQFRLPPKTELEKRVEESRDKPAAEKVELFRAIFEDSDDEDAKMPTNVNKEPQLEPQKLELPSTSCNTAATNAAAANLLRNTSPPRGIFAALFSAKNQITTTTKQEEPKKEAENKPTTKITFKSRAARAREEAEAEDNTDAGNAYGPTLPKQLKSTENEDVKDSSTTNTLEVRLLTLLGKHKSKEDIWIERKADENKNTSDESSSSDSSDTSFKKLHYKKPKSKKSKKSKKCSSSSTEKKKKSKKSLKKKAKSKRKHDDEGDFEHKKFKLKHKKKKHK